MSAALDDAWLELGPVLDAVRAGAAATERDRRLAAADAMIEAGLFRLLLPRSVGGREMAPVRLLEVLEALGRADGSAGWCLCQTSVCSMAAALLEQPVARAMFGEKRAILAWGFGAPGKAVPAEDGWRIGGAWSFGSGAHHASWLGGSCTVPDPDGAPLQPRMMLFPQPAAWFAEDWDTVGLRGTGSDSYTVDGLFVPEALYHLAGAHAVFADGAFERRMRDMHTISQHVHGREQHAENVGRWLLGRQPELQFL